MEDYRVPVPSTIVPSKLIHGAMDNFDHIENSQSGKGSSHDTILMVFQNSKEISENQQEMSCKPLDASSNRYLTNVLDCQQQISFHRPGRASIPKEFTPNVFHMPNGVINSALCEDVLWCLSRHTIPLYSVSKTQNIPSYIALKSLLSTTNVSITTCAFTPIIPYPATEYETIYTCMKNFQDILHQNNMPYGPLWCDEGVYRIVKEIQLLKRIEFQNIFLGIGGFHTEKVVLAAIGKYLEDVGAENVFVETEIFGPNTVKAVMSGGHYVRSKRGKLDVINIRILALNYLYLQCLLN